MDKNALSAFCSCAGSPEAVRRVFVSGKGDFVKCHKFCGIQFRIGWVMPSSKNLGDLVASWEVALSDGIHKIEFEHGTTSGKRVVYIDGEEVFRKDWMFKLVGFQEFKIGRQKIKGRVSIDACSGFAYEYTLTVEGKSLKKFLENKSKTSKAWATYIAGVETRVVFEKDTLDVWVNGEKTETAGEFTDDGTETHFEVGNHSCFIRAVTSGKRRDGIIHNLYIDDELVCENSA